MAAPPARDGAFEVTLADDASAAPRCAVVLFGWVGSTPRLLRRYASAALATGHVSAVYATTARTTDVFMSPAALRALAAQALALLARRHPGAPAVFGYFSNGGALVHRELLAELAADAARPPSQRRYASVRIAATFFDSAPAYLTFSSGSRAVTEGIRNAAVRTLAYALARLLMPLLLLGFYGPGAPKRYWRDMAADPLACPTLYIYSAHDQLTDVARLDELVAARRAVHPAGSAAIRTLRIGAEEARSEHVCHLLRHPARYADALAALLADAAAAGGAR